MAPPPPHINPSRPTSSVPTWVPDRWEAIREEESDQAKEKRTTNPAAKEGAAQSREPGTDVCMCHGCSVSPFSREQRSTLSSVGA